MIKSLLQLLSSSILVVLIGLINTKLVANFFPFEYVGYFGFIKNNAFFLSNIILLGLNYSFFFIEKDLRNDDNYQFESVNKVFNYGKVLCLIIAVILLMIFSIKWYILRDSVSLLWILALFSGLTLSFSSLMCKRDSVLSKFNKFWIYNITLSFFLFITIVSSFFFNDRYYLVVLFIILISIYILCNVIKIERIPTYSDLKVFFKSNISYSKYFQLNLVLSTGFIAIIQSCLVSDANSLSEYNATLTLTSLLNIISTVVGSYIFPRLVSNSNDKTHLLLYKIVLLSLAFVSFIIALYFDFFISLLFKPDFIMFNAAFLFLLDAKIFEITCGILGYKLSASLDFKRIFTGLFLYVVPFFIYLISLDFSFTNVNLTTLCACLMIGWLIRLIYYININEDVFYKKILVIIGIIFILSFQFYWFNYAFKNYFSFI
ncbi:hypothetical protein [Photobacterium leiognathi]|uniref:hypothetical protein n=1 Tax=Photobacterium leiognathi TaxID=553611 RepID=UPI00298185C1|nr:hypothetical protein [Photobacterium leiognathi]